MSIRGSSGHFASQALDVPWPAIGPVAISPVFPSRLRGKLTTITQGRSHDWCHTL